MLWISNLLLHLAEITRYKKDLDAKEKHSLDVEGVYNV